MIYKSEVAAVKVAIKRAIKAGSPEAGFLHLKKWIEKNPGKDHKGMIRAYKKWVERRFYNGI